MSTTATGDAFEKKIRALVEGLVENGDFLPPDRCKIFSKKGYFSKDREKNIIFDVSLELYLPGQDTYSVLFLFECKKYNHAVPVDDAEEFFAKIEQVGSANTKGVICSTSNFQDGCFLYAKSKGIGLLRYFCETNFKWILTRVLPNQSDTYGSSPDWIDIYKGLSHPDFCSRRFQIYSYSAGSYTNSFKGLLS